MKKGIKAILILLACLLLGLIIALFVLKNNHVIENIDDNEVVDNNNYIDEYEINNKLFSLDSIEFNKNTSLEDIKLYGLESLGINKIEIEDGHIKYSTSDKEYYDKTFKSAKYIEYASDFKTYSELLIYTSNGIYYFNTNGNSKVIDEEAKNLYFESDEKAIYDLDDDSLELDFIKLTNASKVVGISAIKNIDYNENNYTYFVLNTSSGIYTLDYSKEEKHGIEMITSVKLGRLLTDTLDYIYYIGKNKKLLVNKNLTIKNTNNEVYMIEDKELLPSKIYETKDAYYFVEGLNIYKLLYEDYDNINLVKYNEKEIEKISLEEEKTYQGEEITSIKQYIKISYADGDKDEIL